LSKRTELPRIAAEAVDPVILLKIDVSKERARPSAHRDELAVPPDYGAVRLVRWETKPKKFGVME
jgi:hypothetical protein